MKKKIQIQKLSAVSNKTGNAYNYISVKIDGVELTRLFYKATEEGFYDSVLGTYIKE